MIPSSGDPRKLDPKLAYQWGLDALDTGDEEAALPAVDAALENEAHNAGLWQVKALLHRALDDLASALPAFERAAALAPRDARIAHGHAHAAMEAGTPSAGLFQHALGLAPGDASIMQGLVAATLADEGMVAAITLLERALAQQPLWLAGHWLMARLQWTSGVREGFTASIERALGQAPRDVGLWQQYVFILMHAKQHESALTAIARARAAVGHHPFFSISEAASLSEAGRVDAAEPLFAALAPSADVGAAIHRIRHLLRMGRPSDAMALAEPMASSPQGHMLLPYLTIGWRLLGDQRWQWLEGDPRFVGVYDIADRLPPLDALAQRLRSFHVGGGQPLEQSLRGGTQTDGPLFARLEPEIRHLRQAVERTIMEHVAHLPPIDSGHPLLARPRGRKPRFPGAWSVRLLEQGHHANHVHPQGWISSALYVSLPDTSERGADPAGWLSLGEPEKEIGVGLAPFRMVEPKPGRLVLFPSYMWHGTIPFTRGERLTVAFDVAPPLR